MATHKIGNRKTTFLPEDGNTTYLLDKGKTIETHEPGIYELHRGERDRTLRRRSDLEANSGGLSRR